MSDPIHIAGRKIANDAPSLVIAEIGVNHDGSPEKAVALVEAARRAGADAVKLQIFRARTLVPDGGALADYQRRAGAESAAELLGRYELSDAHIQRIVDAIRTAGLMPLATPFSLEDVGRVASLGLAAVKIASPDLVNLPLLRRAASLRVPILLSTGGSTRDEIEQARGWLESLGATVVPLHCVSSYPTPDDQANLSWISELRDLWPVVGLSDHTRGTLAGAVGVSLGARVFEKHLTLDRSAPGPDHAASADEPMLSEYVRVIRACERLLGSGTRRVLDCEREVRRVSRQSVFVVRDLPAGHTLSGADLTIARPGTGIPAAELDALVGRSLRVAVRSGTMLDRTALG